MKDENTPSFAGQPLIFQGETLGVLAVFSRDVLTGDDLANLGCFAQHAAAAIANARVFDNIQELQEKLELENDYLREEIGEVHCCGTIVGQSSAL